MLDIKVLESMIEIGAVYTGEKIGADYRHDECGGLEGEPEAVVEAGSTEEVSAVLRLCNENGETSSVLPASTTASGSPSKPPHSSCR